MNSVASPLRMNMATGHNYQQASRHSSRPHAGTAASGSATRQTRDDVLARAQAIAMAQAKIQAQVQGYAQHVPTSLRRTNSASGSGSGSGSSSASRRHQHAEQEHQQRERPGEMQHSRQQRAMTTSSQLDTSAAHTRVQQPRHRSQQPEHQRGASKAVYSHGNCRSSSRSNSRSNSRTHHASRSRANTATAPASRTEPKASARVVTATSAVETTSKPQQKQEQFKPKAAPVVAPVRVSVPVPAPTPAPAPMVWRVAVDPKSKRPYYYHTVTRETTWKKPAELVAQEKREKKQFFSAMEHNIRSKLRDGSLLRDSTSGEDSQTPRGSSFCGANNQAETPPSSRSSASTVSCNSSRSSLNSGLFKSNRSTRSLPTTPEGLVRQSQQQEQLQPQQEPESHETDDEADDDSERSATKRPMLFRTLSSYETPVMNAARKESGEASMLGVPSPIQERVRLAALVPRASDLEAYARLRAANGGRPSLQAPRAGAVLGGSSSALLGATEAAKVPPASPERPLALRRRSNSTNSIYLRMGTMNAPDQDATIQCVATVLRAHMMEALESPLKCDPRFDVFVTARDRQRLAAVIDEVPQSLTDARETLLDVIPTLGEIGAFIKHVFQRAQMESECIIMSLVYVERLLKATSGSLQLRGENWRRILFCSMVMASKVWDDLSMCNADFSKIWPELALKEINELELAYLGAVEYNVRVSAVSYAKYYFHLRSMCAGMGMLQAFDESAPLNLDGARKMQVLSEDYQERSKQMPAPRRRSVTITTTSAMESLQAAANSSGNGRVDASSGGKHKSSVSKASPAASLEQLVQMQVRVAGGSSLSSSMHRLSSSTVGKQ